MQHFDFTLLGLLLLPIKLPVTQCSDVLFERKTLYLDRYNCHLCMYVLFACQLSIHPSIHPTIHSCFPPSLLPSFHSPNPSTHHPIHTSLPPFIDTHSSICPFISVSLYSVRTVSTSLGSTSLKTSGQARLSGKYRDGKAGSLARLREDPSNTITRSPGRTENCPSETWKHCEKMGEGLVDSVSGDKNLTLESRLPWGAAI